MIKLFSKITLIIALACLFFACDKDDPIIPNEEELITTVNYTLTPNGGGSAIVLSFKDLDGDGGNSPIITKATLEANKTYTGTLTVLNETESPIENITNEIRDEDEAHQFFFQSTINGLTVEYTDKDAGGNPLGLSTILTTGSAASGALTIVLRHEPNKSATGVSEGLIANAGGESDIEIIFPIDVQ